MVSLRVGSHFRLSRHAARRDLLCHAGLRACILPMFLLVGLGRPVAAQAVRGILADENGAPVIGAVVVLVDSAGKPVAGGLSGSRGEFHVKAPAAGRYTIRVDRVGHASDLSERIELTVGAVIERTIIARASPVQLAGVVISKARRCVRRPEEGTAIAKVWSEARKALSAADLAGDEGLLRVRVVRYERDLDRGKRVQREHRSQREGFTENPFVSIPPESLGTVGFTQTTEDGIWYYAPDAKVLVSEEFLDSYCFSLRRGRGRTASLIGVAFEPAAKNELPGINGVLWVDQRTAELRHVDYRYTKLPGNVESPEVGGRIEFTKTPTGIWMVQRWRIRMPVVRVRQSVFRRPGDGGLETSLGTPVVIGFRDVGGEVAEISGLSRRTFAPSEGRVQGTVYDSTRSGALSGAEVSLMGTAFGATTRDDGAFELGGIPEGEYTVTFFHPRLDTLGLILPGADVSVRAEEVSRTLLAIPSVGTLASVLCPGDSSRGTGVVTGVVRDSRGNPIAGAAISANWTGRWTGDANSVLRTTEQEASTQSEPDGRYRLCGIPLDEIVELTAIARGGPPVGVKIPARSEALIIADLRMRRVAPPPIVTTQAPPDARATVTPERVSLRHEPGTGIVRGIVTDAGGDPIESAQVRLVGSGVAVRTPADGTFNFTLPPGSHVVDIRRLGYAPARLIADVQYDRDLIASVRLEMVPQQLASMVIAEEQGTSAGAAPGFAERRRRMNGVFVDRQRIDRARPMQLTDLLRGVPGIRLLPIRAFIGVTYVPQMLRASSLGARCPMSYYVDGMEFEPYEQDINADIRPAEIEAIEVYQPSQVPAQFSSSRSAQCGVMVIWTRQEAGKAVR